MSHSNKAPLSLLLKPPRSLLGSAVYLKKARFWKIQQRRWVLGFFKAAASAVPAYKDFLKKNKVDPQKIRSYEDFTQLPPVTKDNYLRAYPMEKLVWEGDLARPWVFSSTSGSTG